jgi:hypothetical protein
MTTFKRVLEEAQNYGDAAHAEKTEEWKGHFARMLAYIGVSTPASFLREESSPFERVDEAYGAVRNLRSYSINKGGLFYPMRKPIRENFLGSLQSVFEQLTSEHLIKTLPRGGKEHADTIAGETSIHSEPAKQCLQRSQDR